MHWLRIGAAVAILALLTLVLAPLQLLATRRNWPLAARIPYHWQRIACALLGVRVKVTGEPAAPPLLIAMNHVSWLDVPVMSSVLPVSFVAKAEVGGWPIVRTLARLQRTVYIDRTRRTETRAATEAIGRRVGAGDVMVLFAEGTTGDGNRILPFKSALIGAAGAVSGGLTHVQPVAISYMGVHGLPVGRSDRPELAWYGDMDLIPHFVRLAGLGAIDVAISFGEPIPFGPQSDRKAVADQCFAAVRELLDTARRTASLKGYRRPLFSPPAKGAKGTADLAGAGPSEGIATRNS